MKPDRPSQSEEKGSTDLWAGIAATVFFVVTVALLGLGWMPLCAFLGLGIYVGMRLLRPADRSTAAPPIPAVSPETLLADLKAMVPALPSSLRARLIQVVRPADALLNYFRVHPERSDPGLFLTREHLQMTQSVTQRWLENTRSAPQPAQRSTQKLEEFLIDVSDRLMQLYNGLTQADDAHLAGEIEALTRTMKEMDEVYQRIGGNE